MKQKSTTLRSYLIFIYYAINYFDFSRSQKNDVD